MSAEPFVTKEWEDTPATFEAYVTRKSSTGTGTTPVKIADVGSISYKVFNTNLEGSPQVLPTGSLTASDVIFDTLQSWPLDSVGFNFQATIPATYFPTGGVVYRVEITITLSGGTPTPIVYAHTARNLLGS